MICFLKRTPLPQVCVCVYTHIIHTNLSIHYVHAIYGLSRSLVLSLSLSLSLCHTHTHTHTHTHNHPFVYMCVCVCVYICKFTTDGKLPVAHIYLHWWYTYIIYYRRLFTTDVNLLQTANSLSLISALVIYVHYICQICMYIYIWHIYANTYIFDIHIQIHIYLHVYVYQYLNISLCLLQTIYMSNIYAHKY